MGPTAINEFLEIKLISEKVLENDKWDHWSIDQVHDLGFRFTVD